MKLLKKITITGAVALGSVMITLAAIFIFNKSEEKIIPEKIQEEEITPNPVKIYCWGDSITEGYGSNEGEIYIGGEIVDISGITFPQALEGYAKCTTYNYGFGGLTSAQILQIRRDLSNGRKTSLVKMTDDASISRRIKKSQHSIEYLGEHEDYVMEDYDDYRRYFMYREKEGSDDVSVIMIGSNGGWNDYEELINQIDSMIELSGCSKYIVVGDTENHENETGNMPNESINEINPTELEVVLAQKYGSNFIGGRIFMLENAYTFSQEEPEEEDIEAILRGAFPSFLRVDETHLSAYGYYLLGYGIYLKGIELGYWE